MSNLLSVEELDAAERIALAYAPRATRAAFAGIFLLDQALRRAAFGGREPALAQIKLAWWRDELARLRDGAANRPHPVLQHLAQHWPGDPEPLVGLADAWEEMGAGEDFVAGAERVASARGAVFAIMVDGHSRSGSLAAARCWSLVDLAAAAPDPGVRAAMFGTASSIAPVRLPAALRPLAVLDGLSRRALRRGGARALIGDRLSPLAAMRLGIFGR